MADFDIDLSAHEAPQTTKDVAAEQEAPTQMRAARKIARKAIALNALADSLATGGGAAAGHDMAVSRKTATDVADEGFSGSAHEVPYRKEMESSFGADFSGVKAYTDGPARKASGDLGAEAYAAGNQVAFNTSSPDKATVAHELTHVLQHTGGLARKSADSGEEGIETSGEAQADAVESAVKKGKKAKSVLDPDAKEGSEEEAQEEVGVEPHPGARKNVPGVGGAAPARKQRPALEGGSNFGMGMSFSPEGMEKSYTYKLWEQHPPIEIPIPAVPGLNFMVEPSVIVKAAGGVDWKKKQLKAFLGVEGGVGVGFSYGNAAVCSLYGVMEAKAAGGFEYAKSDHEWELEGAIALSTNFKVGVKLAGGILDYGFEFGKCEIGKLTGIAFKNGHFEKDKLGWEWGEKPKEFFAAIKAAIAKAKQLLQAGVDLAKKGWEKAKSTGQAVYNSGAAAVNWIANNW
jgi:hypothetical protein